MASMIRSLVPLALAAVISVGVAHADTFTGVVYNSSNGGAVVVDPSTLGPALGAFTVSNFNFNVGPGYTGNDPNFTIGKFLSYGGTNLVIDPSLASISVGSKEILFNGSTYLTNGQTYTFTHDDGLDLLIDGSLVIAAPNQTVAIPSSFTFTGVSGVHNFVLGYASNNLSPSVLNGPFTPVVTPEPSSIMLFGTGLIGMAGALRRRFKA